MMFGHHMGKDGFLPSFEANVAFAQQFSTPSFPLSYPYNETHFALATQDLTRTSTERAKLEQMGVQVRRR